MADITMQNLLHRIEMLEARISLLESKKESHHSEFNSDTNFDWSLPEEDINTTPTEQPGHLCSYCGNPYTHILRVTPQNAGEFVFKVVTIYCSKCGKESQIEIA
jgi:hypothetical protein